ncbi:glycosyl transferase family 2 [Sphingobium chlorophenolicum L-1]|uniref:Glycosyl transferase family 2 n=2 Tax=Sphingobium chlorophenolicum TaxID=46429 RepID=F6F0S8_SPHCR|nr:glycosyl transferase family 2 [Sphingobium chlorophenolicum L-1]
MGIEDIGGGRMNELAQIISSTEISDMEAVGDVDLSIVIPCLNEIESLPHCIAQARQALEIILDLHGLTGEIVVADNGSTDGSQALASSLGARVVAVRRRGYGAALIGGCEGAYGRYLLMGDADGSYNFTEGAAMIERLVNGADLCIGSRFKGGITPGAMPWKNRYIGNPALTGVLNLFFGTRIDDAHCGLRAITKAAFQQCKLTSTGMEFASEMIIKASLMRLRIDQAPATLSPDLRQRAPHLRPWRDGWRHLRYLLMLSPTWVFGIPAFFALLVGLLLLLASSAQYLFPGTFPQIGAYWTLLGSTLVAAGHISLIMALTGYLYSIRAGYRRPKFVAHIAVRLTNLENMLILGFSLMAIGMAVLILVAIGWVHRDFQSTGTILPPVLGTLAITLGLQTALGGFLMAIIGGNEARFFSDLAEDAMPVEPND